MVLIHVSSTEWNEIPEKQDQQENLLKKGDQLLDEAETLYTLMYVCIYVCIYVCMMHVYMYVHTYVCTYVCMYVCNYVCKY